MYTYQILSIATTLLSSRCLKLINDPYDAILYPYTYSGLSATLIVFVTYVCIQVPRYLQLIILLLLLLLLPSRLCCGRHKNKIN